MMAKRSAPRRRLKKASSGKSKNAKKGKKQGQKPPVLPPPPDPPVTKTEPLSNGVYQRIFSSVRARARCCC